MKDPTKAITPMIATMMPASRRPPMRTSCRAGASLAHECRRAGTEPTHCGRVGRSALRRGVALRLVLRRGHLNRLEVALDEGLAAGTRPGTGGQGLLRVALQAGRHMAGEQLEAAVLGGRRRPVVGELEVG